MADKRRALHAYLSPEGHEAWSRFAAQNGVSVTGLVESLGLDLGEEIDQAGGDPCRIRQDWVKRGRQVDAARRVRRESDEAVSA